jgi:hypothetical protein
MRYALIKNNKVVNIIKANNDFITLIQNQYDFCICTDELENQPSIGWDYIDSVFSEPIVEEVIP